MFVKLSEFDASQRIALQKNHPLLLLFGETVMVYELIYTARL